MKSKDTVVLRKLLKYCHRIELSCQRFGNEYSMFLNDYSYQNDCCMSILQIGELCKVLSTDFRELYSTVPWKNWCGIRDIIAHKYEEMDFEIAWDTIHNDLPFLKESIEEILKEIEDE